MFALRGSTALGVIRLPLAILLLTLTWPLAALAAPFQTKAPTGLLIDDNSGATLFEKNADRSVAPASTTKILTAEIVLREIAEGRLHLGDRLPISPKAAREGDAESGGSSMFAQANTQVSIDDLLRGLLITSGNDAAVALAEGIAGSETAFAARMNQEARGLGMSHSSFANAWGNGSGGQRVTARHGASGRLCDQHIPAVLSLFRRDPIHLERRPAAESKPSFGHEYWSGRVENRPLGGERIRPSGVGVQGGRRLILVLYGARSYADRASEGRELMAWGFHSAGR
jgi:D-alanyl-D-alanine carboxypeptidase (penicillin-binding protein 5/6)